MKGPLSDLRVVELSHERCSFAGKLFADMGARVVVVEPPHGAPTRDYPPFVDDERGPERSLYWWHYNTSKLGVTLDLQTTRGREIFRQLVDESDVLIEGEDPGVLFDLGLDYTHLSATRSDLIMVSITPFGRNGPRSDERATDLTLLAGGGAAWSCGYDDPEIPPIRGEGNQAVQTACHHAVFAGMVAVLVRDRSGAGQHVDVNMHAATNVTTEAATYEWLVAGRIVRRQTGRHASVEPSMSTQVRCSDGRYVNTGVPPRTPAEFGRLRDWILELGLESEFPEVFLLEMGMRRETIDLSMLGRDEELTAIFGAGREAANLIASKLDAYDFFVGSQQRGIPVGIIYSPDEVIDDPHFRARGFVVEVSHPELDRSFEYPGAPYRFQRTPWTLRSRAPMLGEHNEMVYRELGMTPEELAELTARRIV